MRRGQLFSMDAMLSLVLVIMILGTVSATSENLRTEITSLIGWYDRANIADNMLDVLVKTPGEPEDWESNVNVLKIVGLRDRSDSYLSYGKIRTLFDLVESGNARVLSSLCNLSSGDNFELTAYITNSTLKASIVNSIGTGLSGVIETYNPSELSEVELRISSINVTYQLPSFFDVSSSGEKVAVINCTSVTDKKTIQGSKNSAPWIEYAERRVPTLKKVYSQKYTLTPDQLPKEVYSGTIDQYTRGMINITFPGGVDEGNLTLLSVFTTPDYTGHSIVAFFKTQDGWIYGANMTKIYPTYNVSGTPENCEIEINNNYATMSLSCLVPPAELGKSVTFTIWAYSLKGFPQVTIEDAGNLDVYLKPVRQMVVIRLWVWPRR